MFLLLGTYIATKYQKEDDFIINITKTGSASAMFGLLYTTLYERYVGKNPNDQTLSNFACYLN